MGNNLFGADIAGKLGRSLGPKLEVLRLDKVTAGARTTGAISAGNNPKRRSYTCRGTFETRVLTSPETLISREQGRVLILSATLPAGIRPVAGDEVRYKGTTYTVEAVGSDPDAATYNCVVV